MAIILWAGRALAGGTHGGRAMPVDPSAPSDFTRYRVAAAFLPLLVVGLVAAWGAARRRRGRRDAAAPSSPEGFDLLALPRFGWVLRSSWWPLAWQVPAMAGFVLVLGAGLAGWDAAGTVTWALWWPAMALLVLAGSRSWCLACPPGALAEWAGDAVRPRRAFPARLRTLWLPAVLLVAPAWVYDAWDVAGSGRRTAALLAVFTLGAVLMGLRYAGRSFCRYVCPVGALAGVLGLLGSLAIVARSAGLCAAHRPKTCLGGGRGRPGCPMHEVPYAMDRPIHCHLCLACARACAPDNLGLVARAPGWALRHGRGARWDEAGFALVVCGVALVQMFAMVGWVRAQAGNAFTLAVAYAAVGIGGPLAVLAILRWGGGARRAGAALAVAVPAAWALFAVHNLDHLVPRWLARWPGMVLWGQAVLLLLGFAVALASLVRWAREAGGAAGTAGLGFSLPLALGLLVSAAYYALSYPPVAAAGSAGPSGPPIAFISDRGGMPEVYLMDAGGGPARRLLDRPLRAETTATYKLSARDAGGLESAAVTISTLPFTVAPIDPFGVQLSRTPSAVTLTWGKTQLFETGEQFYNPTAPESDELAGYQVLRSSTGLNFAVSSVYGVGTTTHTEADDGNSYQYRVRAFNDFKVSKGLITFSPLGDQSVALSDGLSKLVVPADVAAALRAASSAVGQDIYIRASFVLGANGGEVVQTVEFVPLAGGLTPVKNFAFPKPVSIVLGFPVDGSGNPVPATAASLEEAGARAAEAASGGSRLAGSEGSVTPAAAPAAAMDAQNLGMYWNDGKDYKKLYGAVDAANHTVTAQTPNLGSFQVRRVFRDSAATFDLSNITTRVVTPNGDGKNDLMIMIFDNPRGAPISGKVYDLRGAYVATMAQGPFPNSLQWDGLMNGKVVTSGVYIYQVEGDGKLFNGTMVIAR
ncbi:MAG: 4Fe-4S binding protein [Elusimicrobia bacterium]|nr:4Fe-4S binding protein [Elusimicrobiota bacterium]